MSREIAMLVLAEDDTGGLSQVGHAIFMGPPSEQEIGFAAKDASERNGNRYVQLWYELECVATFGTPEK